MLARSSRLMLIPQKNRGRKSNIVILQAPRSRKKHKSRTVRETKKRISGTTKVDVDDA